MQFIPLRPEQVDWQSLDRFADRTIFQTRAWLDFVAESQRATPVIAEVRQEGERVGYFTGLTVRRFGLKILGSPFSGWTTSYLGFNLADDARRPEALRALPRFAFGQLGCVHVEIMDRRIPPCEALPAPFRASTLPGFEVDLAADEDVLLARMGTTCRRSVRKAERDGVVIEEASDTAFVDDYYAQLVDVFARQGLVPTYPRKRVASLMKHLMPTGNLLLLRARNPEGRCIATSIFPGFGDSFYFWGGASFRPSEHANEAMHWYAMRYWKSRGATRYDMGGGASYKARYGGVAISVPWFRASRFPILETLRGQAKRWVRRAQVLRGRGAR